LPLPEISHKGRRISLQEIPFHTLLLKKEKEKKEKKEKKTRKRKGGNENQRLQVDSFSSKHLAFQFLKENERKTRR